jgi:Novel STAND NTPase 3
VRGTAVEGGGVAVVGAGQLESLLDRNPEVRRRVPSLLGVTDLDRALDAEAVRRSAWDVEAARALAPVFVPTRAYRAALEVLERHNFAVLSGPPEMAKTAVARILGLALQAEGWEVHECIRPEQVWAAYDAGWAQLFVADDAFGSTEYHPGAAEHWALELDRILRALDDRHWLVWTSRPAPLRAGLARIHREHGVERFPRPAEVHVDAARLDVEEKALILYRHARAAGLGADATRVVQAHGVEIVEHAHFTPERIRRFVGSRLATLPGVTSARGHVVLRRAIEAELAEPTAAMAASFDALPAEHRALLVALVDAPPGPVPERELAAAARRHAPAGLPRPPAELVDRLTDHFVRAVPPTSVTWVHPSWRDLVIDRLAADADARRLFLERCGIDGALLALSRGGGETGERSRPLLVVDADWDALAERLHELAPELADPDVLRLLSLLWDGLLHRREEETGELAAVAATALAAVARTWERGTSFASAELLRHWRAVAGLLDEPPAAPVAPRLLAPPPAPLPTFPTERLTVLPAVDWGTREATAAIVQRILGDLDAA